MSRSCICKHAHVHYCVRDNCRYKKNKFYVFRIGNARAYIKKYTVFNITEKRIYIGYDYIIASN